MLRVFSESRDASTQTLSRKHVLCMCKAFEESNLNIPQQIVYGEVESNESY